MEKIIENLPGMKGHVICELLTPHWPEYFELFPKFIQRFIDKYLWKKETIIERKEFDNLVVNVAKNGFAKILNNESGFTGIINYGAIGTSTASPAITDTTLTAEVARAVVESNSRALNVTTITFYFDPTTGNGTLKEFGAFIDGTASANTGSLFDRVNIDVVKTSLNSLRITLIITVS